PRGVIGEDADHPVPREAVMAKIQLSDKKGAQPNNPTVKPGEQVEWQNQTSRGRTLTFSVWPFQEPPLPITIDSKSKSNTYTIAASATSRGYSYTINPTINPDDGPPDEPSISVG